MSLLSTIADRLILCPSTDPIDPGENRRELIFDSDDVEIEAWVSRHGDFDSASAPKRLIVLKIPGTGGRGERASVHPAELMVGPGKAFEASEVWTLNHRGYGRSTGPASLKNFVSTIESFWDFIQARFPTETKLVTGNSLGCVSALYLSRHKPIDGLLLRNPPPLQQMISTRPRYNWWSFGLAKFIGNQVPDLLDSINNAYMTSCPALFVTSEKDRVVPPKYQRQIMDVYLGKTKQFIIERADHHHGIPGHQENEYLAAVAWLHQVMIATDET
jgi:pimeloyl-ACP methyl ester carboxylesterase